MLPKLLRLRPGAIPCRCVSCVSRAVVSKPGTGIGAPARANGRGTILFYSSIISTAAALDSSAKQSRRKELDKKISDLEASLQRPDPTDNRVAQEAAYPTHKATPQAMTPSAPDSTSPISHLPQFVAPTDISSKTGQLAVLENLVFSNGEQSPCRTRPASTSRWSMYATDDQVGEQRPWTPKKLLNVEYHSAILATELMLGRRKIGPTHRQQLSDTLQDLLDKAEALKSADAHDTGRFERLSFPQYQTANAMTMLGERVKLNKILLQLCQARARHAISDDELFSKVAYNLLVSPVPPDIHTFSTLISHFSNMRFYTQARSVIHAVEKTHIRQNELCADAILSHYRRTRERGAFHEFVLTIQGYYGGFYLAHPAEMDRPGQAIGIRTWRNKRIGSVDLDDRLLNTIVSGYRTFHMAKSAWQWENVRSEAGYRSDVAVLLSRLATLACKGDWQNGVQVWEKIERQLSRPEIATQIRTEHRRSAYHYMLGLCRNTGRHSEFKRIYEEGFRAGLSLEELRRNCTSHTVVPRVKQILERQRRLARIAQRQAEQLEEKARMTAIYALANKILDAGLSLDKVKRMFSEKGRMALYAAWLRQQPWLASKSPLPSEDVSSLEEALEAGKRAALGKRTKRYSYFRVKVDATSPELDAVEVKASRALHRDRIGEHLPGEPLADVTGMAPTHERPSSDTPSEQQPTDVSERVALPPVTERREGKIPISKPSQRKRPMITRQLWGWDGGDSPFDSPRLAAIAA